MRVLMVNVELPTPERPGTMAPVARQIASLRAAGVDVAVLEIKGVKRLKYTQALPRLWAGARQVDLVHAHYGYCGWLARLQVAAPVVVSFMGNDLLGDPDAMGHVSRSSRAVVQANRRLAGLVDGVIVKSAEMARVVAPAPAHIIPNGVDLDAFRLIERAEARQALSWTVGRRYVLFPGSPADPRKGFALAQAAVAQAEAQLGAPIELATLGGIPPERVPLYMNACDAMTMTSLLEGSPNVVKEAMACDLPVVGVAVGDVPELLAGVNQCAIGPRDADALGAALARILRRGERSDGRQAIARKGLDLATVACRVIGVYEAVLDRRRVGASAPAVTATGDNSARGEG